jgi:hypothetical protein
MGGGMETNGEQDGYWIARVERFGFDGSHASVQRYECRYTWNYKEMLWVQLHIWSPFHEGHGTGTSSLQVPIANEMTYRNHSTS